MALTKAINEQMPEAARANIDEAVVRKLAHCATGELNPMAAMFGGIVGQEVVKAVSGKVRVGWVGKSLVGMVRGTKRVVFATREGCTGLWGRRLLRQYRARCELGRASRVGIAGMAVSVNQGGCEWLWLQAAT